MRKYFKRQDYNPVGRKRWLRREIARVKARPRSPGFSEDAWATATAFFIHHLRHPKPIPYDRLTPLQKRMQSGSW
jgi:hypothetical protein